MKGSGAPRHQRVVTVRSLAQTSPEREAALSLAELFRAHARDVGRWAYRLGGPLMDVEDVVQEVFVVAHQQLASFRGDAAPSTWLFRITENVVRHRRRKDRLRRWLRKDAEALADRRAAQEASAQQRLEEHERAKRLYRVLDQMGERARAVLVMFELEGLSGEQIAELYDARVGTVWVWLHRARADFLRKMQAQLAKEGEQ